MSGGREGRRSALSAHCLRAHCLRAHCLTVLRARCLECSRSCARAVWALAERSLAHRLSTHCRERSLLWRSAGGVPGAACARGARHCCPQYGARA
eukprot:3158654-Rhodomonas_salina.1